MKDIYTLGIDVGSTASKCIMLKNGQEIVSQSLAPLGAGTSGPSRAIEEIFKDTGLSETDVSYTLSTGYGRNSIQNSDEQLSELSCHAKGAYFLFPNVKTVIDIGGQDAKVLKIGMNGILSNFVMNDKCAAGTGRFLDVMSQVLDVGIGELEKLSSESTVDISISSTCTVFAESEVISQLAKGSKRNDIIRGIHKSVAGRTGGLAKRLGVEDEVIMTGGVALNGGVVLALEEELGHKIQTSPLCQYNGALGASIFAYQKYLKANS